MVFYHIKTSPAPYTIVKWKTPEQCLASISRRNNFRRMIDNEMFIKVPKSGHSDPILAWDCANTRRVYVSKHQWHKGGPCITRVEACVLMRVAPTTFQSSANKLGIVGRKGVVDKLEVSKRFPKVYYSLDDIVEILYSTKDSPEKATVDEIRSVFGKGYLTYKKVGTEFIPVWE